MIEIVMGEIDMIEDILFHSDKCGPKEMQKIEDEFDKDLSGKRKRPYKTRIW